MVRNVATFLWRTLFVQSVCRHYIYTALELASVPLITYLFLQGAEEEVRPLSSEMEEVVLPPPRVPTHVVFGPSSEYNRKLLTEVDRLIREEGLDPRLKEPVQPEPDSETRLRSGNIAMWQGEDNPPVPPPDGTAAGGPPGGPNDANLTQFIEETSGDTVASSCKKLLEPFGDKAHRGRPQPKQVLCVSLQPPAKSAGVASLAYTLFVPVKDVAEKKTLFPLGKALEDESDLMVATAYLRLVDFAHILLQISSLESQQAQMSALEAVKVNLTLFNLPGWVFGQSTDGYKGEIGSIAIFAFLIPLIRRINAIEREFSAGLAEHQGVMGLTDMEFFFGHFLTIMIIGSFESSSVVGLLYYGKENVLAWAHDISPSLVAFSFLMFAVGFSLQIIMLTWIFPKGWIAVIAAILLGVSVPGYVTRAAENQSLGSYFLIPKMEKLAVGVFPARALSAVLRIISITRDYERGGGWSAVAQKALGIDNVTILEIWAVMLLTNLVMVFLAWYLSNVLPWSTDNPQSPAFFLMRNYWKPSAGNTHEVTLDERDPARFEELPPGIPTVIVAKNLTKVYGQKPALNGLDMKVYQSKITVLLGHNGAGKSTFMSILTGMQAPTSGAAHVCGFNVTTHRSRVRQLVSFCQQTDIFFENMNCVENLLYFGSLKGVPMDKLRRSIASTLEVVDLQDKAYAMPSELSGGMKRRLSIAITIVSEPKVLILDEPTAGMDPETRRNVWDTLQTVAKERTLILSSHDMDEADAIGDQVVIMASGKVICSGSTAFLKKACGVGYKITLEKDPQAFNLKDVLPVIEKVVPSATVDDDKKAQVTIALKTLDHTGFPGMFTTLEGASKKLGIKNIGVSVASMKDVYLKINMDWTPEGKAQESPVETKDIDAVASPINKQRTVFRVFWALFIKRFVSLIRSWEILLGCVLLPLCLLALIAWKQPLLSLGSQQESEDKIKAIPVSLSAHYHGSPIVLGESPASSISEKLRILLESEGARVEKTADAWKYLGAIAKEDFSRYMSTYPMAMAAAQLNITLMQNPTSAIAMPIMTNLLTTSILREVTAQPAARISAEIAYLQKEHSEVVQNILLYRLGVWMYWAAVPALSYSLGFAAYAAFPVPERLGRARDVQLMTGMWGVEFVFAHLVFDMVHHALFSGVWILVHFAFSEYTVTTAGNYYLAFLTAGPAIIGMAYLLAERAISVGGAISSLLLWVYLGGLLAILAYGLAVLVIGPKNAHYISLLFPPYTILSCFTKIWIADAHDIECELLKKAKGERRSLAATSATFVASGGSLLRATNGDDVLHTPDPCNATSLYSLDYDAMGLELLALLAAGLVCLGILAFLTSGYLPPGDMFAGKEVLADEDVEEEKKQIASLRDKRNFIEHTMLAWSLHKRFGDLRAVRGLYVALKPSECFGLLGVNGAGKTTTFQMLAGLETPSYGDAMTKTATLSEDIRKWQSQVSYCFQIGGLLDRLNAYEYLYLVGRLRGISNADLKPMVESIISVVDLKEHAGKECGVYSGGNRRKLSIGAALLGLQPFVFLDEPYAGVDVVSRNKIFRAIAEIKKRSQTSFMLTSHNMDECEYSCDRLTIMVSGQMCLGTLQHLREKFGRGYRLEFLLKHTAVADAGRLAAAVAQVFPGIKLTDAHENVLCYHLEERIPWSALFAKLAQLQKDFQLEHALVGENTLEQIFLSFAKLQGVDVQPDRLGPQVVAPPPIVVQPTPSEPSAAGSTAKSVKKA